MSVSPDSPLGLVPEGQALLSRRAFWALFLAFCLIWFGTLDYRKLIKPDEGRYGEIAREMAATGDFVTPRLNGIKYFEKPPLQYWATAVAFKAFGEHDWTARLWPALTGFFTILMAAFTATRLFGRQAGLYTGTLLGSMLWMVLVGHINTLDMGLTCFLTLAVSGVLLTNHPATPAPRRRFWALVTWAALALSVLTKGLVALVLAGGTLVVYSALARDLSPWRRMEWLRGLLLFFLITTPWFVAVSLANPEFPYFFFIHEHFERFLTKTHGRYQPAWYFIPILLIGALPWTSLVLQALGSALSGIRRTGQGFKAPLLLAIWAILVFLFFSASSSKLPSYIEPMLPALGILGGAWLTRCSARSLARHILGITLVAALTLPVIMVLLLRAADSETPAPMLEAYGHWLLAAGLIWLLGAAAAWWRTRSRPQEAPFILAVAACLAATGAILGHENLGRSNSSYYLAQEIQPQLPPGVPFYSVRMYEQTLPYYLRRTLTLVDYRDELGYGLDHEPQLWIPTLAEFRQRWQADSDAFAVMTHDQWAQMQAEGWPMREVARDTRRIIVRKTP